jgi:hypothetical protein
MINQIKQINIFSADNRDEHVIVSPRRPVTNSHVLLNPSPDLPPKRDRLFPLKNKGKGEIR